MRSRFEDIEPRDIRWGADGHMEIDWSDDHTSRYSPSYLRSICPCAECTGAHGQPPKAFNILRDNQVRGAQSQTVIQGVEPMGNYAIAFAWGDGHGEGIYTWSMLRSSCPTEAKNA